MSRRLELKNLDSAHDVGPTGSASAQIFVQDGKLMAQLQGKAAVELADLDAETHSARVIHNNTGHSSEIISSGVIATSSGAAIRYVVFSQQITVEEDDVIHTMCEYEVTNNQGYNVMFAGYVIMATTAGGNTGVEISEANGYNVSANMHHGIITELGSYVATSSDVGTRYINVILYSASTASSGSDTFVVEQDYGRLTVLQFR